MTHLVFVAARTLVHRRGSFALLLVAITAALSLQISNSANLEGYSNELYHKGVIMGSGHVIITAHDSSPVRTRAQLVHTLSRKDSVDVAAPRLSYPAVILSQGMRQPITVVGVSAEAEERANGFCSRMGSGGCFSGPDAHEIVLGHALAEELGVSVSGSALVVMPLEDIDEVRYVRRRYSVAGVQGPTGSFSILEHMAFVPIDELQELIEERNAFTSMHVYLEEGSSPDGAASTLRRSLDPALRVRSWSELSVGLVAAIESGRRINEISRATVLLAILLPTLALLWISVIREQRQIAVIRAIGFTRRAIFVIYLLRAILVGLLGSALGVGASLVLVRWFQTHPIYEQGGFAIHPSFSASSILTSAGLCLAATVLGGLAPALHAAFSNPALTLRDS